MTTTTAAERKQVRSALEGVADKVIVHKDGSFTAKKFYFYRHGMTADGFATKVARALAGPTQILSTYDHFGQWPKDSWFEVHFTL